MKSYKELEKQYKPEEIAESFVFPPGLSKKQRDESLENFREFRKRATLKRTPKDKLISRLMQLRFQIEDYLKEDSFDKDHNFGFFLKQYISRLEKKNKDFADEINIDPTELSLMLNNHRRPNEKIMVRLEIHSNKNFPALMWFRLIEKEKAFDLLHDKELRDSERKHVKGKLEFYI